VRRGRAGPQAGLAHPGGLALAPAAQARPAVGVERLVSAVYAPTEPADLPAAYQEAVQDYLTRRETGQPTGLARLRQLHPDPLCHTPGEGRFPCTRCGG